MDFDSIYEKRHQTSAALSEATHKQMLADRESHAAHIAEIDAWLADEAEARVETEAYREQAKQENDRIAAMTEDERNALFGEGRMVGAVAAGRAHRLKALKTN